MVRSLTLHRALAAARSRRLRPAGYRVVSGSIVAWIVLVVFMRFGANLYIGGIIVAGAPQPLPVAAAFSRAGLLWVTIVAILACSVMAFRAIASTVGSSRMRLFPISRVRMLAESVRSTILSTPMAVVLAAAVLSGVLYCVPSRAEVLRAVGEIALYGLAAAAGAAVVAAALFFIRAQEAQLEMMEILLLVLLVAIDPELRLTDGVPVVIVLMHFPLPAAGLSPLMALPFAGLPILLAGASRLLPSLGLGRPGGAAREHRSSRSPALRLYRARLPLGLLALSLAFEMGVILTNPRLLTTVRTVVVAFLVIRVLWFAAFLFRAEQEVASALHPPSEGRLRLALYRRAALLHLGICAVPVATYLIRLALARGGPSRRAHEKISKPPGPRVPLVVGVFHRPMLPAARRPARRRDAARPLSACREAHAFGAAGRACPGEKSAAG